MCLVKYCRTKTSRVLKIRLNEFTQRVCMCVLATGCLFFVERR